MLLEWLGHLHTDSEERGSRGQAQQSQGLEAKEQVMDLGTGRSLCLEVGVEPRGVL